MNARQGKRIIIPGGPGRSSGPPTGGPLIVPEEGSMGGAAGGILTDADSVTTPTPPSRYRPPAGFMNEKLNEDETANMPADVMLGRLQSRAGRWPTFAKMISNLYKQSYDSSVISEMTGISPAEQAKWVVAGTVYDSLKLSGRCSPEVLKAFEEGGENKLGFFRFINVDFRISAANYIVEKNLGIEECDTLARSMKEWERREGERDGFSNHPGDCLAFKYLRDAIECRTEKELLQKVAMGLKVAVTDGARARLDELANNSKEQAAGVAAGTSSAASMLLLRLTEDECGFRCLPMIGQFGNVREADVIKAPKSTQDGAFGIFSMHGANAGDSKWLVLPQWKALTQAQHPVAVEVPDCSKIPAIISGTRCKTDEDRRRLQGPGVLVLEGTKVPSSSVSPTDFYLASMGGSGSSALAGLGEGMDKLEMVEGAKLQSSGRDAVARLLFLCRPPARDQAVNPSAETANLLQL